MQMAMSETRQKFPLSTKKVLKKTIMGSIIWIVLLCFSLAMLFLIFVADTATVPGETVFAGFESFLLTAMAAFIVIVIAFILLTFLYQRWYYAVYFYDLTPDYIIIRKGPITPREITIPYERIQDVYVDQDILDRIFGLYDVHLSSATVSSGMQAHIDGVEKPAADGLRALLLETVSRKIGRKTS